MTKRRKLIKRTVVDWEILIEECLTGAGSFKWGCLNRKNRLFRIATFNSITVPADVVKNMICAGRLGLNKEAEYYKYIPKRKRRSLQK